MAFKTTLINAFNSAGTVSMDRYEVDDDKWATPGDKLVIDFIDYDLGKIVFTCEQVIEIDGDGDAVDIPDSTGELHTIHFRVSAPLREQDLRK
jgi:hypothetical protein